MGIEKVVVKSHGSSKSESICASILQAKDAAKSGLTQTIKTMLENVDLEVGGEV